MSYKYCGPHIVVLGAGLSGTATMQWLLSQGARVSAFDTRGVIWKNTDVTPFSFEESSYHGVDMVVISPGFSPDHPAAVAARKAGMPITGEAELACSHIDGPILAITGTNGKTTVTLMTAHILNASGRTAYPLGNVGEPLLSYCINNYRGIAVAELSSFQLETMNSSVLDAAVVLNIAEDHIDRHRTYEQYAVAKMKIANLRKEGAPLFLGNTLYESMQGHTSAVLPRDSFPLCDDSVEYIVPVRYGEKGTHYVENIMAAYALCHECGVTRKEFRAGLDTFSFPEHRLEFVADVDGISYYNDSKATNSAAVIAAVESLPSNIILIAGGVDKGSGFENWNIAFHGKVKQIVAIGNAATTIERSLHQRIPVHLAGDTMEQAINVARSFAKEGDIVLLSPGCASFDMFNDYAHRGEVFKRCVNTIVNEECV